MCTKGISYFALQITHVHISLHNFWILEQKGIRENESKQSIIINNSKGSGPLCDFEGCKLHNSRGCYSCRSWCGKCSIELCNMAALQTLQQIHYVMHYFKKSLLNLSSLQSYEVDPNILTLQVRKLRYKKVQGQRNGRAGI